MKKRLLCIVTSGIMLAGLTVFGQTTYQWTNTLGGVFSDAGNWSPNGVPGSADTANFGAQGNGTYTVTFTQSAEVVQLRLRDGSFKDITFNLNGHTFSATQESWLDYGIDIRAKPSGDMILRLTNGLVTAGSVSPAPRGETTATRAELIVGEGATLRSIKYCQIADRSNSPFPCRAVMRVENGAQWEHAHTNNISTEWMYVGRQAGNIGTFVVDGVDSTADFKPATVAGALDMMVQVGYGGTGTVHVLNGGKLVNVGQLDLGMSGIDGYGVLRVEGDDSEVRTVSGGNIRLGRYGTGGLEIDDQGGLFSGGKIEIGLALNDTALGYASISNGGHMEAAGDLEIQKAGTLEIYGGTVGVTNTCLFASNSTYRVTLDQPDAIFMRNGTTLTIDADATFEPVLAEEFSAEKGDRFVLMEYGGSLSGDGYFSGLPDEAEIVLGDYTFQIDYGSGTDSQVALDVVGAPARGTVILLH